MINKIDAHSDKALNDFDQKLKYFFLINSDLIIEEIKSHSKEFNLFEIAFDRIYRAAEYYVSLIGIDGKNFFSPKPLTRDEELTATLLKITLRNHCIIEGYFFLLEKMYFKDSSNYKTLSGKNDISLNTGFFGPLSYNSQCDAYLSPYQKYYQFWTKIKEKGPDSFIWSILLDCSSNSIKLSDAQLTKNFNVPCIYQYPILTFFKNPSLKRLSDLISGSRDTNILRTYNTLYINLLEKEEYLTSNLDKFIFRTCCEYYFGFSTFSYIQNFLSMSYNSTENSEYLGAILKDTLIHLAECPSIFSRNLIFEDSFNAIKNKQDLQSTFLRFPPDYLGRRMEDINFSTHGERVAHGLEMQATYFNILNQLTFPILTSLWKIIFDKLFKKREEELLSHYNSYIEKNYNLLTKDLTNLSINQIQECNVYKGNTMKPILLDLEQLNSCLSSIKDKPFCIESPSNTSRQNKDLHELLHKYLKCNQKKLHYTPTSTLDEIFSFTISTAHKSNNVKLENFFFDKAKQILNFI